LRLTDVVLATVQNDLVAPHSLAYGVQGVDDPQAEFTPLHRLGDGDVFYVAYQPCVPQELALEDDAADGDDLKSARVSS
jgi:hypothetical protein